MTERSKARLAKILASGAKHIDNIRRWIAALTIPAFLLAAFPGAGAASFKDKINKENLKKAAKGGAAIAAAAGLASSLKPPKPKPPKVPKEPEIDIPGLPEEAPPANKKEKKKAEKAKKEAAAEAAESAFEQVKAMAEEGDMQAQYIIGRAYYCGFQVRRDDEQAVDWWQKAAKQGHPDADAYIGLSFQEGFGGSAKNQDEANRRFQRSAESGSAQGALMLGIYEYRTGDAKRKMTAVLLFKSAAEKGDANAAAFLQRIVDAGVESNRDFGRGMNWREEAKKTPLADLYTQAGVNAFKGRVVEQDYGDSVAWWEIAAELEEPKAQALLGAAYYTGRGVGADYKKAAELLKLAASQREALGEYMLGKAYLEGNGVQKNNALALKLLRAASARGIADARRLASRLEGRK